MADSVLIRLLLGEITANNPLRAGRIARGQDSFTGLKHFLLRSKKISPMALEVVQVPWVYFKNDDLGVEIIFA